MFITTVMPNTFYSKVNLQLWNTETKEMEEHVELPWVEIPQQIAMWAFQRKAHIYSLSHNIGFKQHGE